MRVVKLLTIGNSFANNATLYLDEIAHSTGRVRFELGRANLGGCSLEKHWNLARYTERHPEYKTYRLFTMDSGEPHAANLQEALAGTTWDFVTLQQVSAKSWLPESFQPHLSWLHELVARLAPQARILLHQTWAYRSDTPFLPQNCLTQELMFERINDAYQGYAKTLKCGVIPAGEAVQQVRRSPNRAFRWPELDFDYHRAEAPALPRQEHSLAVGWKWKINSSPEGLPEMALDANHLNAAGCYLAGCVWFEFLTGIDASSIGYFPAEIKPENARFLQAVAHSVCKKSLPVTVL